VLLRGIHPIAIGMAHNYEVAGAVIRTTVFPVPMGTGNLERSTASLRPAVAPALKRERSCMD
jgi:hypothetical protein